MKRRRINEQGPKLFAFGSTTKQTNAKKSIKVFLQRATESELDIVANALRRITLKAINLSKIDGVYDIAQFKAAVDLLKPEMLETLFGELKQAYPQKIDYNPYVMEPEDMPQQQEPARPVPQQAPAPEEEPQTMQERRMLKLNKEKVKMRSLKEAKLRKLVRLVVLNELKETQFKHPMMNKPEPNNTQKKEFEKKLNSMNWPKLLKLLNQNGFEYRSIDDQAKVVEDLVNTLDLETLKDLVG